MYILTSGAYFYNAILNITVKWMTVYSYVVKSQKYIISTYHSSTLLCRVTVCSSCSGNSNHELQRWFNELPKPHQVVVRPKPVNSRNICSRALPEKGRPCLSSRNSWKPSTSESSSYPSTYLVLPFPLYLCTLSFCTFLDACTLSLLCHLWQSN